MDERRVLVYSLSRPDGMLARQVLGSAGIASCLSAGSEALAGELAAGVGALLVVEELLTDAAPALTAYLAAQETWSDLPILLLAKHGSDSVEAQRAVEYMGNVTLLERPVRTMALVSAARSALRARDRQYQVRGADRRKDEFLATLAHELRNPLAPIRNAMAILQRLRPTPDLLRLITVVERQVGHLTRLVDDLLDVARITSGKVFLQKHTTCLRTVITHAIEIAGAAIHEKGHHLQVEQPEGEVQLHADHARVVQSLANLLVNAAKFTPAAGEIRLSVRVEGGDVEFRVRDNGRGLEPASVAKIFEMFVQAHPAGEPASGLGIGLNLARRFAELHGGTVSASSPGPGRGSEFVLRLPIVVQADHAPAAQAAPTGPALPTMAKKVLVVDDNRDAATTLEALLAMQGMLVAVAHDGAQAVAAVRDDPPDVVVMDIGMPIIDGYEAARQIRRDPLNQRITLIALTGYGQASDRHLAQAAGFDFHFVKPLDFTALLGCLANPVEGRLRQ
jgi:signal transduction histidine kinase/CheY-like chemotaxis protein